MKPINILNKLNERHRLVSTDWKALKDGLSSCDSAGELCYLMQSTMDASDWSKYCDYYYEIDGSDRSSLQSAKQGLMSLANDKIKTDKSDDNIKTDKPNDGLKSDGSFKSKVERIAKKVAKSKGIEFKRVLEDEEGDSDGALYVTFEGVPVDKVMVYPKTSDDDAEIYIDGRQEVEGDNEKIISSLEDVLNRAL